MRLSGWLVFVLFFSLAGSVHAQVKWGGAYNGIWSAGPNWNSGVAPGAGDTVTIDAQDVNQPDYWVSLDFNAIVDFLTMSTSTGGLRVSGRTFETTTGANLWSGKTEFTNSTWNTNGSVNNGGEFLVHSGSTANSSVINGGFSNSGQLDFVSGTQNVSLTVNGESGNSGLVAFQANNGRSLSFNVNNTGTYLNSGTIKAFAPATGNAGASLFRVNQFNNTGTVVNESVATMNFDRANATYENGNIFAGTGGGFSFSNLTQFNNYSAGNMQATSFLFDGNGSAASTMSNDGYIGSTAGSMTFQQLSLVNNGTLAGAGTSTLNLSGINYTHGGGISGFGAVNVTGSNVTLNSNLDVMGTGSLANTTFSGVGTLNAIAGSDFNITGLTSTSSIRNAGSMKLVAVNASTNANLNNGFVNEAGSNLLIDSAYGSSGGFGTLNVTGDFDNSGMIELRSVTPFTNRSSESRFYQTGTLTNQAGGLIVSSKGSAGNYFRQNRLRTDNLVNHGTIRNDSPGWFYFDQDDAAYENHGLIEGSYNYFDDLGSFTNSSTGTVQGIQYNFLGLSSATSTFSNEGSIQTTGGVSLSELHAIDNSGTISVGGLSTSVYGSFDNSGSIEIGSAGTATFSGGSYNHKMGGTLFGGDTLNFNSTTVNLNVDVNPDFANVNLNSATVNGPGEFNNLAGNLLTLQNATLNAGLNNSGDSRVNALGSTTTSNLNSGAVNEAGSILLIDSAYGSSGGFGTLNVTGDFDNSGMIELRSVTPFTNRSSESRFYQTGTLTNHAGGLIVSSKGSAGNYFRQNRLRTDNLINHGTIRNDSPGWFYFDQDDAAYENHGLIEGSYNYFDDLGSFTNSSTGTVQGIQYNFLGLSSATSTFSNEGSIQTTGGVSLSELSMIDNSGIISVGGLSTSIYGSFDNSGSIEIGSAGTATFSSGSYNHKMGGTLFGGDTLNFNSTTVNLDVELNPDFANVNLNSATINGPGDFNNLAGNKLNIQSATLNTALNNSGDVELRSVGSSLTSNLNSGLNNASGSNLLLESQYTSAGGFGTLNVSGDIDNSGTIELRSSTPFTNRSSESRFYQTGTLTNQAGGLIVSTKGTSTYFRQNRLRTDNLVNHGTIRNSSLGIFYFDKTDATYDNHGFIEAELSHISFTGADYFVNHETGVLSATGGNIYIDADSFTNEGTVNGNRAIVLSGGASFVNSGLLDPGQSPGTLSISGNLDMLSDSELLIELAGITSGTEYDLLAVSGSVMLDGLLQVDLLGGFVPDSSDVFTFLTGSNVSGSFANASERLMFAEGSFDVTYSSGSVVLSNFVAVPEPDCTLILALGFGISLCDRRRRQGSLSVN